MSYGRRVTTQDISWFLDLRRNGQLDLDPPYQRKSVWTNKDKRYFLDTVFRGYPSPFIFLNKLQEEGKTIYHVVDGKQRLQTIFAFADNQIAVAKDFGDARLDGKKWKDIEDKSDLTTLFWNYVIPVEFITLSDGAAYVKEVFGRLNRNSRKLVEQELRHAKYDGWFVSFVEHEAEELDWKDLGVVTTARARRMKDIQFLSELLIIVINNGIIGFDQDIIDRYYADYNDPSEADIEIQAEEVAERFIQGRRYLVEMQKHDNVIKKYADDFKNLYSLWAIVVLKTGQLPAPAVLAEKYAAFMEEVNSLKGDETGEQLAAREAELTYPSCVKYHQSSSGATTDELQRKNRLEALSAIL